MLIFDGYLFDLLRIVIQQRLISPVRSAIGVGGVGDVHVVVSEVVSTHFAVDHVVVVLSVDDGAVILDVIFHVNFLIHQAHALDYVAFHIDRLLDQALDDVIFHVNGLFVQVLDVVSHVHLLLDQTQAHFAIVP